MLPCAFDVLDKHRFSILFAFDNSGHSFSLKCPSVVGTQNIAIMLVMGASVKQL